MGASIKLSELKSGDIMLFEAPPEKLSQLISILTNSPVSHAGISDYNHGYVLNEQIDGAVKSPLHPKNERAIYIRRLANGVDTTIVADIATEYVNEQLPYGKLNLALLGIYILGYDFSKDSKLHDLIVSVIKLAIFEIIKIVDKKYYDGKDVTPMVCSQFAAHCYDEAVKRAGFEYKIHYNSNVTSGVNLLKEIIDYIKEHLEDSFEYKEEQLLAGKNSDAGADDGCIEELLRNLDNRDNVMKDDLGKGIVSEEIIKLFYIYGRAVLKLTGSKNEYKDIRKEKVSGEAMLHLFDELLAFQETFITPGNLLSDTTNLLDMGVLEYTEEELAEYVKQ